MKSVDNVIYIRCVSEMFLLSGHSAESFQGSETGADNVSLWSGETETDEGLEVSQQMMESLLLGAGTQLENEEYLMGISIRLQTALQKMLMAITDTTNQVQTEHFGLSGLGSMYRCRLVFTASPGELTLFSCLVRRFLLTKKL